MRKVILACAILLGLVILFLGLLAFRYRAFIGSFLSSGSQRVNILVLGKGGAGHEAPDLTDTIILASVGGEKISLISLPRDIWVPEIRAKLNSAYYWGKEKGLGFTLVDESVEKITNLKVNYNLVVDFSVFKGMVDSMGGVEVDVKNEFVDEKYPIVGKENDPCLPCRFETVKFEKGRQIMDGETALKFVRSRNAEGDEGTDIARETRQQLVISAIQAKLLSPDVYLSPKILKSLWKSIAASVETDLTESSLGLIAGKIMAAEGSLETQVVPEELLFNPPVSRRYDNQYVFVPKAGDWGDVQKWIENMLLQ